MKQMTNSEIIGFCRIKNVVHIWTDLIGFDGMQPGDAIWWWVLIVGIEGGGDTLGRSKSQGTLKYIKKLYYTDIDKIISERIDSIYRYFDTYAVLFLRTFSGAEIFKFVIRKHVSLEFFTGIGI